MKPLTRPQRCQRAFMLALMALPTPALRLLAGPPGVKDDQELDPQCQLLLRLQRLRGADLIGKGRVDTQRALLESQSRVLEPCPSEPIATRELRVAGGEGDIPARLYRPRHVMTPAPAVVFYHGGGFVLGSLDSHDGICRVLAERANCVVIAIDYRLAPEHPAPAGVMDAVAAFRDVVRRAAEWRIDSRRIAVTGDSAGANLAAVTAQRTCADTTPPCFQLLFYPTVDFARDRPSMRTFAKGFLLEKASMDWFREHYLGATMDRADPRVSPLYGTLAGLAPARVITAGFDPLRDEGEAYAAALRSAGVVAETRRHPGLIHGFLNVAGAISSGQSALFEAAHALAGALRST